MVLKAANYGPYMHLQNPGGVVLDLECCHGDTNSREVISFMVNITTWV